MQWSLDVAVKIASLFLLAALVIAALYGESPLAVADEPASYGDDCVACHTDVVEAFRLNPHSRLEDNDWHGQRGATDACTSCHSNAQAHIEAGGGEDNILAYKDTDRASVKRSACMECHGKTHPRFLRSPHGKGNMDCTTCHSVHHEAGPRLGRREVSESCRECHGAVFAQFDMSEHHRLKEGVITCTSCHDPHEPSRRAMLGGFKQNECTTCHTDKAGPFIFEHASQRIEGCSACHEPHGSPNRHQLKYQRVASMCYSCHPNVAAFHANPFFGNRPTGGPRFDADSNCVACHVAIHGSNVSEIYLK